MIPKELKQLEFKHNRSNEVEYVTLKDSPIAIWIDEKYRKIFPELYDKEGFNQERGDPHHREYLAQHAVALLRVSQEYRDYIINFVIKNRL